ncbi:Yip1 family protein [Dictyobacter arantiisoli]|uniref:Yip1 domain-containing protein n=1 Tax=Dictyobacter arantiisoli TaxID=2014874 RepID=A0A5A5THF3_9CHLR|nr:Yip1 family protein [Dictyobacter arantiisoli]GCF10638.1 hypothetical protein KDI_42020 [Dictyobacter arantiisoli]
MSDKISYPAREPSMARRGAGDLCKQYLRVMLHPSIQTFAEEKQYARWSSIWIQLIGLSVLSAILTILALLISPSSLTPVAGMSAQTEQLMLYGVTAILIIAATPISFLIAGAILCAMGRVLGGQGRYVQQLYTLALFGVPMVLLSSVLQLIPGTTSWLPYLPHLYSVYLLILSMQAIHKFKRAQFIGVTAIICILTILGIYFLLLPPQR